MAFGNEKVVKVKKIISVSQKYTDAEITSSRTTPANKWYCDFASKVRFIGKAHERHPNEGDKIRIKSCCVDNGYLDKEGKQCFTKYPTYIINDYEIIASAIVGNEQATKSPYQPPTLTDFNSLPAYNEISNDEDLPF